MSSLTTYQFGEEPGKVVPKSLGDKILSSRPILRASLLLNIIGAYYLAQWLIRKTEEKKK
jgi:hypothetical protein